MTKERITNYDEDDESLIKLIIKLIMKNNCVFYECIQKL